ESRARSAQLLPNSRLAIAAQEEVIERERVLLRLETWRSSLAEDVRVPVDVAKAMKCDRESLTRQVRTGRLERLGRKQRRSDTIVSTSWRWVTVDRAQHRQ